MTVSPRGLGWLLFGLVVGVSVGVVVRAACLRRLVHALSSHHTTPHAVTRQSTPRLAALRLGGRRLRRRGCAPLAWSAPVLQ
jgi:hypothetical protein